MAPIIGVAHIAYIPNKKVVGLRLEDLKLHPKETMKKLCKWMNINDEENLYNMTAQGKKWWGDRTSLNTKAFGEMPKKKKNILILVCCNLCPGAVVLL